MTSSPSRQRTRRIALPLIAAGSTFALSTLGLSTLGVAGADGPNEPCPLGTVAEIKFDGASAGTRSATSAAGDTYTATISNVLGSPSDINGFDYTTTGGSVTVLVKGGQEVDYYEDRAGTVTRVTGDGKTFGVSNVKFCFPGTTATKAPTASASPSATATATPSTSASASASPSTSLSPSASASASTSASPSTSGSPLPSSTATASPGATASPSVSGSPIGGGTTDESSPDTSPSASPSMSASPGAGGTGATPSASPIGGGTTDEASPEASPVASPIAGGNGGVATPGTTPGSSPTALPFTGFSTGSALLAGWAALVAGFVMVVLGRRKGALTD